MLVIFWPPLAVGFLALASCLVGFHHKKESHRKTALCTTNSVMQGVVRLVIEMSADVTASHLQNPRNPQLLKSLRVAYGSL